MGKNRYIVTDSTLLVRSDSLPMFGLGGKSMEEAMLKRYWLLKAEPDSRIVNGKDVKFSVDDFERVKTSPWDGVRNYEARNLMKEMKVGEKALFYHSNCKNPGIAAFAQVEKEAYPDHTAWDPLHPYYDPKSRSESPKWFMINLTFSSRTKNFIPLAILRFLSRTAFEELPQELKYIGEHGLIAIKGLDLVTRGRLSVQRVSEEAWSVIVSMAEKGGWEGINLKQNGSLAKAKRRQDLENEASHTGIDSKKDDDGYEDGIVDKSQKTERGEAIFDENPVPQGKALATKRKRKEEGVDGPGPRKSTRTMK